MGHLLVVNSGRKACGNYVRVSSMRRSGLTWCTHASLEALWNAAQRFRRTLCTAHWMLYNAHCTLPTVDWAR